jgi:LmbE family N-acetylglucosaminyl deacetylase
MKDVLFVSPHPDDSELGGGGLISKLASAGHRVTIAVVVGDGDLTMHHSQTTIPFSTRIDEQTAAAKVLGASCVFLNIGPASKLDTVPLSSLVSALDQLLPKYEDLYVPYPSYNQDHRYVFEACMAALRPTKADHLSVYLYEQLIQYHGLQLAQSLPSRRYVKLTPAQIDVKLKALAQHNSQVAGRTNQVFNEVVGLARMRGAEIGAELAEMYHVLRTVE